LVYVEQFLAGIVGAHALNTLLTKGILCCCCCCCRSVVTWYMKPWCMPGEVMTDMYYPIYADGLYEALMQARRCLIIIALYE
jgi:hypothetical protein